MDLTSVGTMNPAPTIAQTSDALVAAAVRIIRGFGPAPTGCRAGAYSCPTMSTEISTAGMVPLFSSQCVVFLSSGQPTPGP